ncbi:MAG: acyltransferase family protein [Promethearchaeota archaeon]
MNDSARSNDDLKDKNDKNEFNELANQNGSSKLGGPNDTKPLSNSSDISGSQISNLGANEKGTSGRLFQIDFLKAWMIFLVIMDHTFTHHFLFPLYSSFWERISIPVFLVVMGFNFGKSAERSGAFKKKDNIIPALKNIYSKKYFDKKIVRFVMPYLILFFIQAGIYIIVVLAQIPVYSNGFYEDTSYILFGYTPFWGPGMWFIPVILDSIFVLPLWYFLFKRHPKLMLLLSFIVEILIELGIYILYYDAGPYHWSLTKIYFICNIFFLISAITLGFWLSLDYKISSRHNVIIWLLFIPSVIYIYLYSTYNFQFNWLIGDYHLMFFPYSAFIVMIVLNIVPKDMNNKFSRLIKTISESTYHILLFEMLYFSIVYHFFMNIFTCFDPAPLNYIWFFPLNVIITFYGGILWKKKEREWLSRIKAKSMVVDDPKKAGLLFPKRITDKDGVSASKAEFLAILGYNFLYLLSKVYLVLWLWGQFLFFVLFGVPGAGGFWTRLKEFITNGFKLS